MSSPEPPSGTPAVPVSGSAAVPVSGSAAVPVSGSAAVPVSGSAATTAAMRGNRRADTRPEVAVRSSLWRRGLRFRKDHRLRLPGGAAVRPDVVFPRARLAVFVDGCYWHVCPEHGRRPTRNTDYWQPKLDGNVARDRAADAALQAAGWTVVRIWEHEDPAAAADRVAAALAERSGRSEPRPPPG